MKIFPAIDLFEGKAVRLFRGDYDNMTVYSEDALSVAKDFVKLGAQNLHIVDLEGAKSGKTPNLDKIKNIIENTDLFVEVGGGIRSPESAEAYLSIGAGRVILGTAAVLDRDFLKDALAKYGEKIAVGADIKDGVIAIKGWQEKSALTVDDFFGDMEELGVKTIICTDISKDGVLKGTNVELYKYLKRYNINVIASGGVSGIDDIARLKSEDIYGAIIGKAYYEKQIDLSAAIKLAR